MSRPSKFLLAAVAVLSLFLSATASAQRFYDPPGRVARISDMRGYLSYSPAGDGEWYDAHRNRPLLRGDALWSDRGARAELQAGSTWIRLDQETSLEFLELDDRMLQLQVTEGSISVRIRRLYPGQRVEIDTPNLALVIDRPGSFRIDVDREGDNTTIDTRDGYGMVYGTRGRFPVRRGDVIVFYGEDLRDYEMYAFPSQDNFDRYVRMRDQRIDRSLSLRYLGDDLVGFSDLDDYGRWSRHPGYGNVWFPSNVYAGWAPYQDGEWIWQEPWGWTWVDDEPWGFAPSHYGRWAWVDNRWGWVPGSRTSRSVYAPALVAFIEDIAGSIGWFPLGPGDIYYPTYSVSSRYFSSVNAANTSVAAANLGNAYQRYGRASTMPMPQAQPQAGTPTSGGYRNRNAPRALTVVPKDVFTNSRPVREAVQSGRDRELLGRGEMRRSLSLRPAAAAIRADAPRARVRPPRAVEEQQVIVRTAPPAQQATPAPSAPADAAPAVRERPRRVRMISEQQAAAADVRATTKPQPAEAAAPAAAGAPAPAGQLRALDREALPRARGGRRLREQPQEQGSPSPAPAATPAPASAPAPATAPVQQAQRDEAREAEEARAAEQKAREERRQAMEAQRKAEQEQRQAEQAQREAQQQREQAQADAAGQQQREAAQAEVKAREERQQAQRAQMEAQRQQRESERAQREAAQQQAQAQQAGQATEAVKAAEEASAATGADATGPRGQRRECVPQERIDAMRKRGVSEERIAELKVCPAEPAATQQ